MLAKYRRPSLVVALLAATLLSLPGATQAASYGPADQISGAGDNAGAPALAVDADGRAVAAWVTGGGTGAVKYAERGASGDFGLAQTISGAASGATAPSVAIEDGVAVIAWVDSEGAKAVVHGAGQSFGSAVTLSTALATVAATTPAAVVDVQGTITVMWVEDDTLKSRSSTAGAAFDATEDVSDPALGSLAEPVAAPIQLGGVVAAWVRDGELETRTRQPGDDDFADPAEPITSTNAFHPSVDANGRGSAVIAWFNDDTTGNFPLMGVSRAGAGGDFTSPQQLSASADGPPGVSIFESSGEDEWGAVHVVWGRPDGPGAFVPEMRTGEAGADLGAATPLTTGTSTGAAKPQIALRNTDLGVAAWQHSGKIRAWSDTGPGTLGNPVDISDTGASQPRVGVDGAGIATVIWLNFDGSEVIVEAATNGSTDGPPGSTPAALTMTAPAAGAITNATPTISGCAGNAPGDGGLITITIKRKPGGATTTVFAARTDAPTAQCSTGSKWSVTVPEGDKLASGLYTATASQDYGTAGDKTVVGPRDFEVREAPTNTSPPKLSGMAKVGQSLKASPGTWTWRYSAYGEVAYNHRYNWQRCAENGGGCVDLDPAKYGVEDTQYWSDLPLRREDAGRTFRVRVTTYGVLLDGSGYRSGDATAVSVSSGTVASNPQPPIPNGNKVAKIVGMDGKAPLAETEQVIALTNGDWHSPDTSITHWRYRWLRCGVAGNAGRSDCVVAQDKTAPAGVFAGLSSVYKITEADERRYLVGQVYANNADGPSPNWHEVFIGPVKPKPIRLVMPEVRSTWVPDAIAEVERKLKLGRIQVDVEEKGVYMPAKALRDNKPGNFEIGDVIYQTPKAKQDFDGHPDRPVKVKLEYWLGDRDDSERCDKVLERVSKLGAGLDATLDLLKRMGCRIDDLRINRSCKRKLDEPQVKKILMGRDGRVDVTANVSCRAERHDLFGWLTMGARGIGQYDGAMHLVEEDWRLTLNEDNVFGVKVLGRTGQRFTDAKVRLEGAGIQQTETTNAAGTAIFKIHPKQTGMIDILLEASDGDGKSIFGLSQARVEARDHCEVVETITGEKWRSVVLKDGDHTMQPEQANLGPHHPCRKRRTSEAVARAANLDGLVNAILGLFGANPSKVPGKNAGEKLANLAKQGVFAVQSAFASPPSANPGVVQMTKVSANSPVPGAYVISTGGGNVLAAAGSNVISTGGGNVISTGGGNVISTGGGNLISDKGLGLRSGKGELLALPNNGGYVISTGGGNVISTGGGNVISTGGGNVIATGGGNVISTGGGNVISTGGGN